MVNLVMMMLVFFIDVFNDEYLVKYKMFEDNFWVMKMNL